MGIQDQAGLQARAARQEKERRYANFRREVDEHSNRLIHKMQRYYISHLSILRWGRRQY
jgi:hypothetical protein